MTGREHEVDRKGEQKKNGKSLCYSHCDTLMLHEKARQGLWWLECVDCNIHHHY